MSPNEPNGSLPTRRSLRLAREAELLESQRASTASPKMVRISPEGLISDEYASLSVPPMGIVPPVKPARPEKLDSSSLIVSNIVEKVTQREETEALIRSLPVPSYGSTRRISLKNEESRLSEEANPSPLMDVPVENNVFIESNSPIGNDETTENDANMVVIEEDVTASDDTDAVVDYSLEDRWEDLLFNHSQHEKRNTVSSFNEFDVPNRLIQEMLSDAQLLEIYSTGEEVSVGHGKKTELVVDEEKAEQRLGKILSSLLL